MGITVAVCLDDEGGMTFFGRRQSRDRVLIDELCNSTDGQIYINEFSRILFKDHTDRVTVSDNPLDNCPDGGLAFIENLPLLPHIDRISRLIVYKWNRLYPYDVRIDLNLGDFGVLSHGDFVGSSHEKITKLTLVRKKNNEK